MSRCSASNFASSTGRLTVAPVHVLLARRLAHDELVVRRAAGVLPGLADQRSLGGELALAAAQRLLVERGRAQVPVDASRPNDAQVPRVRAPAQPVSSCRLTLLAGKNRQSYRSSQRQVN